MYLGGAGTHSKQLLWLRSCMCHVKVQTDLNAVCSVIHTNLPQFLWQQCGHGRPAVCPKIEYFS